MAGIQIKGDSRPMLPKGFATPYLAIFNSQLSVIRDPNNNMPISSYVTHFEYTYDEEKVDKGKIDLETNNPDLIALTELSYGQGLQLQWGYIYSDGTGYYGPVRKVIITNSNITFGQSGVKITIEVSDSSVLLKTAASSHFNNTEGFVKYVEDLCKGVPIGIALVDYNGQTVVKPKVAKKVVSGEEIAAKYPQNINTGAEWATESPLQQLEPKEMIQTPTTVIPDAVGVKLLEWNGKTQKLTIKDPDNFRKVYLKEEEGAAGIVVGTSRSKYFQLQDICRSLSGGPYFVDSRDNQVIIHNVKSQRNITKVYTYMGGSGELLEFTVKTNYVKTSVEVKQSTEIDPDTKDVKTNFVQAIVDPNQGNEDGKGIDTHMLWPSLGTPLYNPRGGTAGYGQNGPAWQPVPGKDNRNKVPAVPEYHVMMDEKANARAIKAAEEKPKPRKKFNSVSEAKEYYTMHPDGVSQEEIDQYFSQWVSDWNSKKTATSPNALDDLARQLDRIPPMKVKRSITIKTLVNLSNLGRSMKLSKTPDEAQTEAFKNAVLSGQIDLNSYSTYGKYSENDPGRGEVYRRNAEALLSTLPGVTLKMPTQSGDPGSRVVIMEADIEIEMNGVDVVAGADTVNMASVMGNDIMDRVTNKVKATARVIGDPVLESSMNIQIQNVSSKYNGLWYTKKVTHTIDHSSGYTCDIEFVQRTIPVSTVTIKSNWTKKDYGQQILSAIKQAKETGDYKRPSTLEMEVKNHITEVPNSSYVIQIDPTTGEKKESTLDIVSGTYIRRTDGSIDYSGSVGDYLQDLQKQVDKLK